MKAIIPIITIALTSGCVSPAKIVHELAKDPATVRARIITPYGVIELDRTAPRTNSLPHSIKDGSIIVGQP